MTKSFYSWYKRYVSVCNEKYSVFVSRSTKSVGECKLQYQKLIEIRMKYTNLSQENAIDDKISMHSEGLANLERKLENLKSIKQGMNKKLLTNSASKVFDKINKHEKIEKITVTDTILNIYTKKLRVKGHNIGNFKISYYLENDVLRIKNLEYVVNDVFDHWHIRANEPCLSEWRPILWRQLDTYQLFFFIDTIIHYLLISDSTHAYVSFDIWIKSFENKSKIEDNTNEMGAITVQDSSHLYTTEPPVANWGSTTSITTNSWSVWYI